MYLNPILEDYHNPNPEQSLMKQIGWMAINAYKYGGVAVFENDDIGKQLGANYIIGAPYEPQMYIHDDKGSKSLHNNPRFWWRYVKLNYSSPDNRKGTYFMYSDEAGNKFVYHGKFVDLKIDPEGRWTHNSENYKIIRQYEQEKQAGSFDWFNDPANKPATETGTEQSSQLTEQVSRLKNLMGVKPITEGFFGRMMGSEATPEKKAQALAAIQNHPTRAAAYQQFQMEDPMKADKYVEFFAIYPNGYPVWDGEKFVEQVPTPSLNELSNENY